MLACISNQHEYEQDQSQVSFRELTRAHTSEQGRHPFTRSKLVCLILLTLAASNITRISVVCLILLVLGVSNFTCISVDA